MDEQSENRTKEVHLGFIQSVITRMGQNSLQAKSWCIALTVAVITFYTSRDVKSEDTYFLLVLGLVDLFLLIIDVYYFLLEKRYRILYKVVAGLKSDCDVMVKNYDMEIPEELKEKKTLWDAVLSDSTLGFYVLLGCCQLGILLALK